MEKQIICILNPFAFHQKVKVFENSNEIYSCDIQIVEIYDTLFAIADKYQVTNIGLFGNDGYAKKIGEKLEKSNIAKYNKKFNIEILNK